MECATSQETKWLENGIKTKNTYILYSGKEKGTFVTFMANHKI